MTAALLPHGCGAPASMAPPVVSEPTADAPDAAPCPYDLPAIVATTSRLTFEISGQQGAFNEWTWREAGDDTLIIGFALRDDEGRMAGEATYVCDGNGLALAQLHEERFRMAFAPPLPVLPEASLQTPLEGSAVLAYENRSDEFLYRFSVAVEETTAPVTTLPSGLRWRHVESVLSIDVDGDRWVWENQTWWGDAPDLLLPGVRLQRQQRPDRVRDWEERAAVLERRPGRR